MMEYRVIRRDTGAVANHKSFYGHRPDQHNTFPTYTEAETYAYDLAAHSNSWWVETYGFEIQSREVREWK